MRKLLFLALLSGCAHSELNYVDAPKYCDWGDGNPVKNVEVCSKLQLANRKWIEACQCHDYERFHAFEENEYRLMLERIKRAIKDLQ